MNSNRAPWVETVPSSEPGGQPVSFTHHPLGHPPPGFDEVTFAKSLPPNTVLKRNADGSIEAIVRLPNGVHNMPEQGTPYNPVHPRSLSMADSEGAADSHLVEFIANASVPLDFEKLKSRGAYSCVESKPIPLYLSHVLWAYTIRLEKRGEDDKYSLSLVSLGSHLSPREQARWVLLNNDLPGLPAPPHLMAIAFPLKDTGDMHSVETVLFEPSSDGSYAAGKQFTEKELRCLEDKHGDLYMRLNIGVGRAYFSLASIIDLQAKPTVSACTRAVVETILRGEKPAGSDWEITGGLPGSGDASKPSYHMHKAALVRVSPMIKKRFRNGKDMMNRDCPEGCNRINLCLLTDDQLRMVVRIAYGVEVPLPSRHQPVAPLIEQMHTYFGDHFYKEVVPQWEREICRKALALDIRHPSSSSMAELLHLLNVIWDAPYGYFPVAKRVAIGVLADMLHLSPHPTMEQFMLENVQPNLRASGCRQEHLLSMMNSMAKLLKAVARVRKTGPPAPPKEDKEEEEEEEEESEEVPNENSWTCTIS